MVINPNNTLKSQYQFATCLPTDYKHPAIIGGFGSGKTYSIPLRWLFLIHWRATHQKKKCRMMLVEPTKEMVRDVLIPSLDEYFDEHGIQHTYHKTHFDYTITLYKNNKAYEFTALLRSSDEPASLTGKNLSDIIIDEFDKKHSIEHQRDVWKECISRIRSAPYGSCAIVTTPEGYKYTYELYNDCEYKDKKDFRLFKAKTYENKFLPPDYIDNLYNQYSSELIKQYIEAEFINLTQGKVYYAFDRVENNTDKKYNKNLPLELCVDFNINPMRWCLIQHENGKDYVIDEIAATNTTTEAMAKLVAKKYGEKTFYIIYGDYSGNNGSTRSLSTDYDIIKSVLKNVQLQVQWNPPVVDRINAVNSRFRNSRGERRLFINIDNCPLLLNDLEQVVWMKDKKDIDKKSNSDLTHSSDALGYNIAYKYPLKGNARSKQW